MAKIPRPLHEHINAALFPNTPLIGSVDADGYPRISLRGSTCVLDKKGRAVLVKIERAENLRGQPLEIAE